MTWLWIGVGAVVIWVGWFLFRAWQAFRYFESEDR